MLIIDFVFAKRVVRVIPVCMSCTYLKRSLVVSPISEHVSCCLVILIEHLIFKFANYNEISGGKITTSTNPPAAAPGLISRMSRC